MAIRSFHDPLSDAHILCMNCTSEKYDLWLKRKGILSRSEFAYGKFTHLIKENEPDLFVVWINSDITDTIEFYSALAHELLHLTLDLQRYMNNIDEDEDEDVLIPSKTEEMFCYHYSLLYMRVAKLLLKP